jgi:hypothetical protein
MILERWQIFTNTNLSILTFRHILISNSSFMDISNSIRRVYRTFSWIRLLNLLKALQATACQLCIFDVNIVRKLGVGWWFKRQAPVKRGWTSTRIHVTTSQETVIFVVYLLLLNLFPWIQIATSKPTYGVRLVRWKRLVAMVMEISSTCKMSLNFCQTTRLNVQEQLSSSWTRFITTEFLENYCFRFKSNF